MGISLLFALELSSLSCVVFHLAFRLSLNPAFLHRVALVVLFGDSMSFLIPRLSSNEFKLIGFFM